VLRARCAALGLLLALPACAPLGTGGSSLQADPVAALPVPADAQEATVVRGVDGDTVVLRGRGVGPLPAEPTKVRVLLIDTPEVFDGQQCFGPEAADRTAALLPDGARVRVQADQDQRDRFDRVLLHVWNDAGVHVGADLLRGGYATVLFVRPNDRYLAELQAVEQAARAAGRGLWSACR
jgi:micrococcal nuclease